MKQDKTITSKRIKRRIITILIIMIAFFIMNMIAARIVFHFIFTRYEYAENNIDRIYSAEDASLYPREDVTFCSGKSKLTGRLYRTDSPKGILILAHGMHSYADRYLDVTEFFVDHGWDVLAFNMTGTYSSEGRDTVGLAQMKLDVIAAIHYVQGNSELCELPIVLYGHSMGGYAVATAIEQETDIAGVVCLSAFNRPTDIMRSQAKQYVGILADISYPFMWLQNTILFGSNANRSAAEVLKHTDIPVLVIYGTGDEVIPEKYALYSHKDEIDNPCVSFLLVEQDYRNEHSTLWLTSECARYTLAVHEEMDALDDKYHRDIPDDVYSEFMSRVDMSRLNVLDPTFMNMLDQFLTEAVKAYRASAL